MSSEQKEKVLRIYSEIESLLLVVEREIFDEFTAWLQGFRSDEDAIKGMVDWIKTLAREAERISKDYEK
ncbi:MAG: hypothetical protein GXO32_03610 [Crenarchaeota archaeon]|nr:hypothetical protein [Thermoproteota archaeon]